MAKNKKRDTRYTKSRAVKNSAKKAAAAAVLKRQQLKEAKEREAGNKEPSIDTDTGHEAQNNEPGDEEEPIAEIEKETANEEPPVKAKPAFNLRKVTVRLDRLAFNPDGSTKAKKKKAQDADLKGGSSPPEKRRRMTRSTTKVGCSSDGQVADDEVTRYFARKKIGLTNAKLRHRGPRISKGHPSMAPKKGRCLPDDSDVSGYYCCLVRFVCQHAERRHNRAVLFSFAHLLHQGAFLCRVSFEFVSIFIQLGHLVAIANMTFY
ncbi:hypothetical protein DAPPUDRAFT_118109 [Daphnia pulex]|uniref:Uncharacterized protein n=1 Tax=Daphnia pulex TaxID=6669 RepID=E9HUR8_DAPPU|nr:hypothetical protein DAPPUDRAFT_118109 [Daphnia pulex]|eukprot:EFX64513.1 hypothetical protein DAPPUDRAFT_118109 [Daphnia pulex]